MKNEKMVTLTLNETQFGFLFNAYLDFLHSMMTSRNLTDEDKSAFATDVESTSMLLWNALPVFFSIDLLSRKQIVNIDWGYYEGYHDELQS
jgi:hypothetical protein